MHEHGENLPQTDRIIAFILYSDESESRIAEFHRSNPRYGQSFVPHRVIVRRAFFSQIAESFHCRFAEHDTQPRVFISAAFVANQFDAAGQLSAEIQQQIRALRECTAAVASEIGLIRVIFQQTTRIGSFTFRKNFFGQQILPDLFIYHSHSFLTQRASISLCNNSLTHPFIQ